MAQNHSWAAGSRSAGHEFPHISSNLKAQLFIRYRHFILSSQSQTPVFIISIMKCYHPCLVLPNNLFPSGHHDNISSAFLSLTLLETLFSSTLTLSPQCYLLEATMYEDPNCVILSIILHRVCLNNSSLRKYLCFQFSSKYLSLCG
jgi:hypothetical protein